MSLGPKGRIRGCGPGLLGLREKGAGDWTPGLWEEGLGPQVLLVTCPHLSPFSLTVNNWLATVTLGQAGMHATYYHKASNQVSWSGRRCRAYFQAWAARGSRAGAPASETDCCPGPSSCRWVWSLRPAQGCRTQVSPSGTSWTCPRPTSSSKVQASVSPGKRVRGDSALSGCRLKMMEGSMPGLCGSPRYPETLVKKVGAWAPALVPHTSLPRHPSQWPTSPSARFPLGSVSVSGRQPRVCLATPHTSQRKPSLPRLPGSY